MIDFTLAWKLLPKALGETLYMVGASAFFSALLGLPIGLALFSGSKNSLGHKILSFVVNVGRSFPFAILMIALIPFTKWLIGTSLGTTAAIIPLSIAAAPFFARLVESALKELDSQMLEAVSLMGASFWQLTKKVLIPEALPSLTRGFTLTVINLISYSSMAGLIGGGGLGQVALQYGYQRFNTFILSLAVVLLFLLVESSQRAGNSLIKRILRKRGLKPQ
jgi:D-methionine transport system permease protein